MTRVEWLTQTLQRKTSAVITRRFELDRIPADVIDAAKTPHPRFPRLSACRFALGAGTAGLQSRCRRRALAMAVRRCSGRSSRASYLDAVQAMATAAHCGELDDIHGGAATCIGAMIVPALLAMAEKHGGSGRQFLEAAVAGYETIARIGLSIDAPKLFARGWWPSTVCGAFGVAAAGAKFLDWPVGTDRECTRHRIAPHRRHAHRRTRRRDGASSGFRVRGAKWHARIARHRARAHGAEARIGRSARLLSHALC